MTHIEHEWSFNRKAEVADFCRRFLASKPKKRFLLGCNIYSKSIADAIEVAAFVETESSRETYCGLPVINVSNIPIDGLVVSCPGGRPLSAKAMLDRLSLDHVDYFAFLKWSGLALPDAVFNENGPERIRKNRDRLQGIFNGLADDQSKAIFQKILNFRLSYDLECLSGFMDLEKQQYFEGFIHHNVPKPVFVDVGCFDGFTSEEFLKRVPDAVKVFALEPEVANLSNCRRALAHFPNASVLHCAAGSAKGELRFTSNGSGSALDPDGDLVVNVDRLDNLISDVPTFIKMDIEGAEVDALEGARQLVSKHAPALAICVYHSPSHLWEVYEKVLSMRPDYEIYIRHYTESIYETVMYFVPKGMVRA